MKKVFMLALVGIVLSVASYGVYKSQAKEYMLSDIALANIEALHEDPENLPFKSGYEASFYPFYLPGMGYPTQIPCCKYNGIKYSGCSAIEICN